MSTNVQLQLEFAMHSVMFYAETGENCTESCIITQCYTVGTQNNSKVPVYERSYTKEDQTENQYRK